MRQAQKPVGSLLLCRLVATLPRATLQLLLDTLQLQLRISQASLFLAEAIQRLSLCRRREAKTTAIPD
jgi:hypothetical protein